MVDFASVQIYIREVKKARIRLLFMHSASYVDTFLISLWQKSCPKLILESMQTIKLMCDPK